jgi:hypothetical protein
MVVPGGGLSPDGEWIACRPGFFLPVRVLSRLFRRLVLNALEKAHAAGQLRFFSNLEPLRESPAFARFLAPLRQAEWVVYAKPPFGGPLAAPAPAASAKLATAARSETGSPCWKARGKAH